MAFPSDNLVPVRSFWAGLGRGLRLGMLGLVIAVAAAFGTHLWVKGAARDVEAAQIARAPSSIESARATRDPGTRPVSAMEGLRFLEIQDAWESRLNAKANHALSAAFRGHVSVTVSVELDPHAVTSSGVNIPEDGIPPNILEIGERHASSRTPVRDPRDLAIPSDPNVAPAAAGFVSKLRREPGHADFERKQTDPALYGQRNEVLLSPVIKRITASVLIDDAVIPDHTDAAATKGVVAEIVKHAIGFDESRGDRLQEPAVVAFASISDPVRADQASAGGFAARGFPIVALIVIVLLVVLYMRRSRSPTEHPEPTPPAEPGERSTEKLAAQMCLEIEKAIDADSAAVSRALGSWATETPA